MALPFSPLGGRFCIFALRFSQDGFEILGGANDGNLYLFDRMASQETLRVSESEVAISVKNVSYWCQVEHITSAGLANLKDRTRIVQMTDLLFQVCA